MDFDDLPKDLKNIISGFAYECKWETVEFDLEMCKIVKSMDVSAVFLRRDMWSLKYKRFLPNPLQSFEPIANFTGAWSDFVDWHSVQELLWRLDFRRKFVKVVASRMQWREKFNQDWKNIVLFDGFYRYLLSSRVPCFKPIWKPVGFSCLQSYRSPHISARWFLRMEML